MIPLGGPSDEQIQDYIDGRLGGPDLMAMAAYLRAHPEVASEVETLRRQNEALKRIGQEVLDEPIPERLRGVLRPSARGGGNGREPHSTRGFLAVLVAILLVCVGAPLGGSDGWNPSRPSPAGQTITAVPAVSMP
jgi:anti-sigma factor RsiW